MCGGETHCRSPVPEGFLLEEPSIDWIGLSLFPARYCGVYAPGQGVVFKSRRFFFCLSQSFCWTSFPGLWLWVGWRVQRVGLSLRGSGRC
jgi:hypothetical protein